MRYTQNANEFCEHLERIHAWYKSTTTSVLDVHRREYLAKGLVLDVSEEANLEYQVRAYAIDAILSALNWRIASDIDDAFTSIVHAPCVNGRVVVEAQLRNRKKTSVRLDYLGIDRDSSAPILAIETKRPLDPLPRDEKTGERPKHEGAVANLIARAIVDGSCVDGEWREWLGKLREYLIGISDKKGEWPLRAAITNGEWLVIFLDPKASFTATKAESDLVRVIQDIWDVSRNGSLIFELFAYQHLTVKRGPYFPAIIGFTFSRDDVVGVMRSIRVAYSKKRGFYKAEPSIYVHPMLFLATQFNGWIRVHEPKDEEVELPSEDEDDELLRHLFAIDDASNALLKETLKYLNMNEDSVPVLSIEEHYSHGLRFKALPSFSKVQTEDTVDGKVECFELATGTHSHYLLMESRLTQCIFHAFKDAKAIQRAATEGPVENSTRVINRSFFTSGSDCHCAHIQTLQVKQQPNVSNSHALACVRSGGPADAFCEVYTLDRHLCCQRCIFHDVCKSSSAFVLPCHK